MTLVEFLLARIAEDEAVAQAATAGPWVAESGYVRAPISDQQVTDWGTVDVDVHGEEDEDLPQSRRDATHIARHDPARVLAECEAKRRIVAALAARGEDAGLTSEADKGATWALRESCKLLALPYADHPDYDETWRP